MNDATRLPQLGGKIFLTDGGIETALIFLEGLELPHFAAFHLLREAEGRTALRRYYVPFAKIARERKLGFILESPTWRSSPDWGARLGYSRAELDTVNRTAIALMRELREELATPDAPMVISGCVGPRGDGYDPGRLMSADEAASYHAAQIGSMAEAGADMISAITMTHSGEAIGVARAARDAGLPSVIAFTVETDGRLPTGENLGEAISAVDSATENAPAYYMINCAHPTHFMEMLENAARAGAGWVGRLRGIRANASRRSHQELNDAPDLDAGDPVELGREYAALRRRHPQINVLGGCCGTDQRHLAEIARQCAVTSM